NEDARRPARAHGRRSRLAGDERDLADEVPGAELVDDSHATDDFGLAVDEDDELPASRTLLREVTGGGEVELVREHGDLRKLAPRAALEQRDALQQLDLGVLAQHGAITVSCMAQSGAMIVDAVRSPIGQGNGTLSHV